MLSGRIQKIRVLSFFHSHRIDDALSVKAVTGKPILYAGMGEKLSDLEQFHPDRMASRILGTETVSLIS